MTQRTLGLRTVDAERRSNGGLFQWPSSGRVVAPDWRPDKECGYGLHALLWGVGEGELLKWEDDAVWQAVWIDPDTIVDLGGKVKFPACTIACEGTRLEVIKFMVANGANAAEITGGVVLGEKIAVANGYCGHATANGAHGHAIANGYFGHATTVGQFGHATANGMKGQATAAGFKSQATASGPGGRATVTERGGRAVANGDSGVATALCHDGVAIANGYGGRAYSYYKAAAGVSGIISITYTTHHDRSRVITGYVGEDGIEPGVLYMVHQTGKLMAAE